MGGAEFCFQTSLRYLAKAFRTATMDLKIIYRNLIRLTRFELFKAIQKLLGIKSIYTTKSVDHQPNPI